MKKEFSDPSAKKDITEYQGETSINKVSSDKEANKPFLDVVVDLLSQKDARTISTKNGAKYKFISCSNEDDSLLVHARVEDKPDYGAWGKSVNLSWLNKTSGELGEIVVIPFEGDESFGAARVIPSANDDQMQMWEERGGARMLITAAISKGARDMNISEVISFTSSLSGIKPHADLTQKAHDELTL